MHDMHDMHACTVCTACTNPCYARAALLRLKWQAPPFGVLCGSAAVRPPTQRGGGPGSGPEQWLTVQPAAFSAASSESKYRQMVL